MTHANTHIYLILNDFQKSVDESLNVIVLSNDEISTRSNVLDNTNKNSNFKSLLDLYEEAGLEAAELENTIESYMKFYNKYKDYLYFPMHKEDWGFYLPVSDKALASKLNIYGEVIIGNQKVDMKDITNYAQLQESGAAYYDDSNTDDVIKTRSAEKFPSPLNLYRFDNTYIVDKKRYLGKQGDTGWIVDGNRKIRLKVGRRVHTYTSTMNTDHFTLAIHYEVSFRKKMWYGWVNYTSKIDNSVRIVYDGKNTYRYRIKKEENSSHDYYFINILPNTYTRTTVSGDYYQYLGKHFVFNVNCTFRGFGYPFFKSFEIDRIQYWGGFPKRNGQYLFENLPYPYEYHVGTKILK